MLLLLLLVLVLLVEVEVVAVVWLFVASHVNRFMNGLLNFFNRPRARPTLLQGYLLG
jgi:hypothetical protein